MIGNRNPGLIARVVGGSVQHTLNTAAFSAPLKTTLVLAKGTGSPTFTRADSTPCATHTDFEGIVRVVPANCARFQGARLVRNLIPAAGSGSASLAVGANKTVTVGVGTFVFSMGAVATANSVITFTGTATGLPAGTLTANATKRTSIAMTITVGGTVIMTASGAIAVDLLLENTTGQSNQNPSEYVSVGVLSAPYQGAGVDGVQYFPYLNGNTVASNVVTEGTGAAIKQGVAGVSATAPVDASGPLGYLAEVSRVNYCLQSEDFTQAVWTKTNVTPTSNAAVAPNGTQTADTLTATAGNGTTTQGITTTAVSWTFSIYLKRLTGTGNVDITMDGSTWVTQTINSSTWTRCVVTQTGVAGTSNCGIRLVTNADAVYAWGGQAE